MGSAEIIVIMSIAFLIIAIVTSSIYYFSRYYFKISNDDPEVVTKKPVEIGLEWKGPQKEGLGRPELTAAPTPVVIPTPAQEPMRVPVPTNHALRDRLETTRSNFWGRIASAFGGALFKGEIQGQVKDDLEEALYLSDIGPKTAEALFDQVSESLSRSEKADLEVVRGALKTRLESILNSTGSHDLFSIFDGQVRPVVWMIVGVNGAGKTTTIGKLASMARARGLKTLIIAGDTFRAAADSQLKAWADRAGAEIHSPENVNDPSAVAYSGLERGRATHADLIIIDTAGRLHTQQNLMDELKKMKRVMAKVIPEAPHERILVIDANAGQNALIQAREFHAAVALTGVIVTKMDGSAKGGIVVGIAGEVGVPITHIGVGESVDDLRPFSATEFIDAVIGAGPQI